MAYTIPAGAIIAVQVLGRVHEQRTRTTFWYHYRGVAAIPDGVIGLLGFLADFDLNVGTAIRERCSTEWQHEHTSAQVVDPTRFRAVFASIDLPGEQVSQSLPSGVAVVIRRTTDRSGRRYQGRIYLPGVPTAFEDDSMVAIAERPNYAALAIAMTLTLDTGDPDEPLAPIVSHTPPVLTLFDSVEDAGLDPVLRYQRRREIGVGE
jgi:hypothetical protein